VDQNKPWDLAKKEGMEERLHDVCTGCIEALPPADPFCETGAAQLAGLKLFENQPADRNAATRLGNATYRHLLST
jgi:hypothetical protein